MIVHMIPLPDSNCMYIMNYSEETGIDFKFRSDIKTTRREKVIETETSSIIGPFEFPIELFNQIKESYDTKNQKA